MNRLAGSNPAPSASYTASGYYHRKFRDLRRFSIPALHIGATRSYGADVEIPRIDYSVRELSPWTIHMNGNNLFPITIVLLALCVGASRAWADPVITGFSLALIDG